MRERILARVRHAAARRDQIQHPGPLDGGTLTTPVIEAFATRFTLAGGEVVLLETVAEAASWLRDFAAGFGSAAVSALVPADLRPALPSADPADAELSVSLARYAAADSGSLLLDSREGRRLQLLAPTHLVWVFDDVVLPTLAAALAAAPLAQTAALALHSGPSKSADIGGTLVTGVHGPGRLIAVVVGRRSLSI